MGTASLSRNAKFYQHVGVACWGRAFIPPVDGSYAFTLKASNATGILRINGAEVTRLPRIGQPDGSATYVAKVKGNVRIEYAYAALLGAGFDASASVEANFSAADPIDFEYTRYSLGNHGGNQILSRDEWKLLQTNLRSHAEVIAAYNAYSAATPPLQRLTLVDYFMHNSDDLAQRMIAAKLIDRALVEGIDDFTDVAPQTGIDFSSAKEAGGRTTSRTNYPGSPSKHRRQPLGTPNDKVVGYPVEWLPWTFSAFTEVDLVDKITIPTKAQQLLMGGNIGYPTWIPGILWWLEFGPLRAEAKVNVQTQPYDKKGIRTWAGSVTGGLKYPVKLNFGNKFGLKEDKESWWWPDFKEPRTFYNFSITGSATLSFGIGVEPYAGFNIMLAGLYDGPNYKNWLGTNLSMGFGPFGGSALVEGKFVGAVGGKMWRHKLKQGSPSNAPRKRSPLFDSEAIKDYTASTEIVASGKLGWDGFEIGGSGAFRRSDPKWSVPGYAKFNKVYLAGKVSIKVKLGSWNAYGIEYGKSGVIVQAWQKDIGEVPVNFKPAGFN
jgi:hypothetical protein